ncbi:MAG: DUF2931 family protein [Pseudomonas sp.]|nr:DUF2931 family protein [Pseudomonas sp.]
MRKFFALLGLLLLGGCQPLDPLSGANDPKDEAWHISFTEPAHMEVWVEISAVEDIQGWLFRDVARGAAAGSDWEDGTEVARGWGDELGSSLMPVTGADLPKRIYVRWQSIADQTTYKGWVDISEETRAIMRRATMRRCPDRPGEAATYLSLMNVGLAPGGIIQIWVRDECRRPIKTDRAQVGIEPLGPHQGKSQGHYYPQSDSSKRYIERFGIPYGSW